MLYCFGGSLPAVARVPIPESTFTLVVTKDPAKKLHYCQLFDHERPISGQVMLTGYMSEDLAVDRVESHGDQVNIFLSGGDYSVEVQVDSSRGLILRPTDGRPSAPSL